MKQRAMSDKWWFQADNEAIVWRGHPKLSAATSGVGAGILICVLAAAVAVLVNPWVLASGIVGIGIILWAVARVRRTKYLLTTRSVWLKRGILRQTVRRVGLSKVQNTAYSQSITGTVFGFGTVEIEVAGGRDLRFQRIDTPESVQTAIADRVGRTETNIPGSIAQWRSVLTLVRDIRTAVE